MCLFIWDAWYSSKQCNNVTWWYWTKFMLCFWRSCLILLGSKNTDKWYWWRLTAATGMYRKCFELNETRIHVLSWSILLQMLLGCIIGSEWYGSQHLWLSNFQSVDKYDVSVSLDICFYNCALNNRFVWFWFEYALLFFIIKKLSTSLTLFYILYISLIKTIKEIKFCLYLIRQSSTPNMTCIWY